MITKEDLEFVFELSKKIADTHNEYRNNDCSIKLEHHGGKDYWTIDFILKSGNSVYEDCIVFYLMDDFDAEEILTDFDKILRKAKVLHQ